MKILKILVIIFFGLSVNCYAQDTFDMDQFIIDINNEIQKNREGVIVRKAPAGPKNYNFIWAETIARTPQDFAVIAVDAKGEPVDMFGASTPFNKAGGVISVPGYNLPEGGSFKTVGAAGWNEVALKLAAKSNSNSIPNKSISKAINTISSATDYIAQELCSKKSRPTKLILNLNAGFELVFNASTGSEVEWDLEIVCKRIQ